jgi:hypothetical protein
VHAQSFGRRYGGCSRNQRPTWLAPLASWLQAMANLRLIHLLRRSAPVKLYDRWMLFFCKQGKQGHDECCPAHAVQPSKVGQAATLWNPYAYFCPNTHAGLISLLQWNNTQHRGTGSISQCTGNVLWPTTGPPLLTVIQKLAQSLGVLEPACIIACRATFCALRQARESFMKLHVYNCTFRPSANLGYTDTGYTYPLQVTTYTL